MAKFDIASQGKVTPEGLESGAAFGAATPIIGKALGAAAERLHLSGLMNPLGYQEAKRLLKFGGDEVLAKTSTISEFIRNSKIYGSAAQQAEKLKAVASAAEKEVADAVASVPGNFKSDGITAILEALRAEKKTIPGLMDNATVELEALLAKSKGEGLSLAEIQRTKRLVDDQHNIFSAGLEKDTAEAARWSAPRRQLKTDIEDIAAANGITGIKEANNTSSVARSLSRAIEKKADSKVVSAMLNAIRPGPIALGIFSGVGAYAQTNDPSAALKAALVGVVAGQLGNPALASRAAQGLYKLEGALSAVEMAMLNAHVLTDGKVAISDALKEKASKAAQNLTKDERVYQFKGNIFDQSGNSQASRAASVAKKGK